jgi:hypothetical protein
MAEVLAPPPWNLEQLIEAARERLDDLPGDVVDAAVEDWKANDDGLLWTNSELAQYADEAQFEIVRRRPIKDNTTAAITQIAVTAAAPTYPYHASILQIEDAYFVETVAGTHHELVKRTHADMRDFRPLWRTDEDGKPDTYIEDLTERSVTLYRTPDVAGTLFLTVRRLPKSRLNWNFRNAMLECAAEHQYNLLDWILYRAYAKDDIETRDERRAKTHLDEFNVAIGVRPSAAREQLLRNERNTYRRTHAQFF